MEQMKSIERKIYEACSSVGECLEGNLHIIDSTPSVMSENDSFRVYHKFGYCFDVTRERICDEKDYDDYIDDYAMESDGCTYTFSSEWEGFESLTPERALQLLTNPNLSIFS